MGPRSKVTNLCALVICYVRKMGPDFENKRHSSLKILFTSVLDKRVNMSVHPVARKDGGGASQLLARATQITYYALKQIPEHLEK